MPKSGLNVALKGLDDLFSSEETRQEEQREQVQQIPVSELFPFKNHPFKVLDDDSMTRTVESISQFGVLAPLIARPRPEGGYEIISGHRRKHAAELANLDTVPVIVRNMEDDAATILMVDSNLQREHKLCTVIDNILLNEKPADFEAFLQKLEQQGYEIKRGKHTSVKGARQKRFIRFRTLGAGYSEDEIKAVIAGEAEHRPHQKQPPKEKPFHLLVDIQAKLSEGKSESYARWAKRYNLKEMSKTLIFLQENKIGNIEEMQERVNAATARYHELGDSIKAAEQRMAEIAVLRAHIINYAKTRPVYDAYRKAGYSKKFLEEHREQITLHRAAKATFDEAGLKKLPKVKELNTEYSTLLSQKKAAYPAYRKARDEMQELMKAQKNVEIFFAEEKTTKEKAQTR